MGERSPQICVTLDKPTASTLAAIKEEVGISEVELTRVLIRAICRHYEKFGHIRLPIEIATDQDTGKRSTNPKERAS